MAYTQQEQIKLNKQLKKWQERQLKAVKKNNIDKAFECMSEIDRAVWEKVANAETYKDVNWIVWNNAESVISK